MYHRVGFTRMPFGPGSFQHRTGRHSLVILPVACETLHSDFGHDLSAPPRSGL